MTHLVGEKRPEEDNVDKEKPSQKERDAIQEQKLGLDRRSVIKGAFLSAAALGGTFAPTIKAFAQSGASTSFPDVDVTAATVIVALRDMTAGLIGPADALKTSIIDKFNLAYSALGARQADVALARLGEAEVIITNNQAELDASNGGLEVETQEGPPGVLRKIGDLLKRGVQWLESLGNSILTFFQKILSRTIDWLFRCLKAFVNCLNNIAIALAQFLNWFIGCLHLLVIPFFGKALFIACLIVCARLLRNQVQNCLNAFVACVAAC